MTDAAPKPFLPSQTCRLLIDLRDRLKHLTIRGVRGDRQRFSHGGPWQNASWTDSPWWEIDRQVLMKPSASAPQFPFIDATGKQLVGNEAKPKEAIEIEYSIRRIILTGDGGTGKSTNASWLAAKINRSRSGYVAFRLELHTLPRNPSSIELDWLIPLIRQLPHKHSHDNSQVNQAALKKLSTSRVSNDQWLRWFKRLQQAGKLILIFDGLDQVGPDSPIIQQLRTLVHHVDWAECRFVVAGRPYAIRPLWTDLFEAGAGWQIVALDEFSGRQQRALLGDEKFDAIPTQARSLLANPRTLDYVKDRLTIDELRQAKTAAFLYERATRHMLMEGMNHSEKARMLGLNPGEPVPTNVLRRSFERAQRLLAAIAFEMTSTQVLKADTELPQPNFELIRAGEDFETNCKSVRLRLGMNESEMDRRLFEHDLDALAALNNELQQGFWDSDADSLEGLSQILWRDRTLQEFYTALHMSKWATETDAQLVKGWLYVPYDTATEEYQMIWQFAAELPETSRNASSWVRSLRPVYRPGDGTIAGARRSTELLYRSWTTMEAYARQGNTAAQNAINGFLGEFQQIVDGMQNPDRAASAKEFQRLFITVKANLPFQFGTPIEKQGMLEPWRGRWERWLATDWSSDEESMDEAPYSYPFQPTKAGKEYRTWRMKRLGEIHRSKVLQAIEDWFDPKNESAVADLASPSAFQLHRYPTLRRWYQLFDPGHGKRSVEWFTSELNRVAPTDQHPQLYVTWYDAWAFCKFTYWNGQSCRLPHEDEWEKAAKGGNPWEWRYWWGDGDDASKRTAGEDYQKGESTRPIDADPARNENAKDDHCNPLGFVDILGNQWEWCVDEYRDVYSRTGPVTRTSRVCRGGAWNDSATFVRCSVRRYFYVATYLSYIVGFRVSRALEIF